MTQDVEMTNNVDVDEDDRYGYTYPWIKNRTFLKQLVKDNIDISIFEKELPRGAQQRGTKSWRDILLGCLRSNLLQIFLSLLVLLDAGIVISEIVLEIQSLQSYKHNFHTQLAEVRRILCQLMYSSSPRKYHHPQCPMNVPGSSFHSHGGESNQTNETKPVSLVGLTTPSQLGPDTAKHPIPATHGGLRQQDDLQKDNELLESMYNLMRHWVLHYENNLECALNTHLKHVWSSDIKNQKTNDSVNIPSPVLRSSHPTRLTLNKSAFSMRRLYRSVRRIAYPRLSHLWVSTSAQTNISMVTPFSWLENTSILLPQIRSSTSGNGIPSNFTRVLLSDGAPTGLPESYDEVIIDHRPTGAQTMHEASEILHYLSISITSLFMFCVILKILCLGRRFFRDTNEYLDAGIIVASFASDILYVRYVSETAAAMVVLLLWRIIRIINALMMHKQQQYELRISMQKRARRLMGRKLEIIRTEKEMQDKHILALEELLRELGITQEVIRRCKPHYKKCTKEQTSNALKSIAALTTGVMGGLVGAPHSMQGVISRFSGTTGMDTPTISQKSLQQVHPIGSTMNLLTKRPYRVKSGPMELDSVSDGTGSVIPWPKYVSGDTLDRFDRRSHVYSPPPRTNRHRAHLFGSSRRSLFQDLATRGCLTRGTSVDSEYPQVTVGGTYPNPPPVDDVFLNETLCDTNERHTSSTVVNIHALHAGSVTPPGVRLSVTDRVDGEKSIKQAQVNIQDLCYPRTLRYLQRFRLTHSRNSLVKSKLWKGLKQSSFEDSRATSPSPVHSFHGMKKMCNSALLSQQEPVTDSSILSQLTNLARKLPEESEKLKPNTLGKTCSKVLSKTKPGIGEHPAPLGYPLSHQMSEGFTTNENVSGSGAQSPPVEITDALTHFDSSASLVMENNPPTGDKRAISAVKPTSGGNSRDMFSGVTQVAEDPTVYRSRKEQAAELVERQNNGTDRERQSRATPTLSRS